MLPSSGQVYVGLGALAADRKNTTAEPPSQNGFQSLLHHEVHIAVHMTLVTILEGK
jgi:hypothetical protein